MFHIIALTTMLLQVEALTQREPGDGVPASQHTSAAVSRDERNLYIVFTCEDDTPAAVRAHLAPREAIGADDQVAVLLDTFHDRRHAYLFAVNPLGVQADALVTEGQPDDYSYDAVWSATGQLTERGYVVSITIPFKTLRAKAGDEQSWGVALRRSIPRNSEESYWPAITRRMEGLVPQFATLDRLGPVITGRNAQLIPYAATAAASVRDGNGRLVPNREARAGVDAKLVARDALTVDVAVNPDFSQVESDQPQVTTNQRFEVFFPEKRPFFIENAGYFLYSAVPAAGRVPESLFFSRRIADPDAGTRVTGKIGRWAIGALAVRDRVPATDAAVGAALVRLQREVGRQSTIGVLASTRDLRDRGNQVAALDARIKLGANWVLAGMLAASRTRDGADGQSRGGSAINLHVNRTSRRILYNLFYSDRSPAFRADLGFVPRTDIRQIEQYIEYRWRPSRGPVVAVGPNSFFRFNWDRQGSLQDWIVRYPFQIDLKGRTSVFGRRVESGERFRGIDFREHLQTINVSTEWLRWLTISEGYETGRGVNYNPPPGLVPAPADFRTVSLALSIRPTPQFRADVTYLDNTLPGIFDSSIGRLTANYQFTRALSVRTILDYRVTHADASKVALSRSRQLIPDVLVTYLVQPGTALYAGYTAAFDQRELRARQLLIKASYLVRF